MSRRARLYARWQTRHNTGVGLSVAGWSLTGLALAIDLYEVVAVSTCNRKTDQDGFETSGDCFNTTALGVSIGLATVGVGFALVGSYYRAHPHPIEESEAKALADRYNQGLRRELGLPV